MGPFTTNALCANVTNAGALGLVSTSGLASKIMAPEMFEIFIASTPGGKEAENPVELYKVISQHAEAYSGVKRCLWIKYHGI